MERSLTALVLAKLEVTYGVDPTPTGAANTIAVVRNTVKYGPKFQKVLRQIADGSFSKVLGSNVLPEVDFGFTVELRGNRTDGAAADISSGLIAHAVEADCLLQSCDLAAVYTAESAGGARDGKVIYSPYVPADQGKSCTFYFFTGLKRHIVTGCKGSFKINMVAGQYGTIDFSFSGLYVAPTDVAVGSITPTWLNTLPPLFQNSGSSIGAYNPIFSKIDFDFGATVSKRDDANSAKGVQGFIITDRSPKASIDPESVAEATSPFWADLENCVSRTITAKIGTQSGNKFQLTLVGSPEQESYGDRSGVRTQPINYSIERASLSDTPGSEVQLQFN